MGEGRDQRDLVLDQSQCAFVLDETKGGIISYVGPTKVSLAGTDRPVRFRNGKFEACQLGDAIQNFPKASEGYYIVLENPADDFSHPHQGAGSVPKLQHGRKINIPGPATFPLYPGQVATVIQGHLLRSNQYLVIRVHNEEEAKKNWDKAIMKSASDSAQPKWTSADLTIGRLFVITGADASFYIPPTGIEVVPDSHGNYVREAVTLERLEYAILLSEDGNKRWPMGPAVIFPEPTEVFVSKEGKVKFSAIELNENSGIYIKVIADYEDEAGTKYKAGDELFITGKEQSIYFPRPEHALIKYGDQEIHYAIAIPEGEGRYVLDKVEGKVNLITGPKMFLPDPRREVIVRRVLDERTVGLWFPGNTEALLANRKMAEVEPPVSPAMMRRASARAVEAQELSLTDVINRKVDYTAPRTITLDTKYDGAVRIDVFTGYAVMVVNATGEREVVKGPKRILLEYNETLEKLALSTGKPKNTDKLFETVYLRILHNKISDIVTVETSDHCEIDMKLSYRVNFTGDESHWFDLENYVKFLCDHVRSILKCAAKKQSVENLYANATSFVRDTVLGVSEDGKRHGRLFEENGMHVYDVEVLSVSIKDPDIQQLLAQHQKTVVRQNLILAEKRRNRDQVLEEEKISQEVETARAETAKTQAHLTVEKLTEHLKAQLAQVENEAEAARKQEEAKNQVDSLKLAREEARYQAELDRERVKLDRQIELIKLEMESFIQKASSVSPQMIQALQAFGDKLAADAACKSMAPLAILGGNSVADVVKNMFSGTSLGEVLDRAFLGNK